ncbi:NRDE family protein [Pararhodospirillum oryzae]|uniref:NRDE family protein n=1 Tax=Pararhodospirillum oryzae TaxID=478448 RepID=A0A512H4M5_9PROT|nr:NRDE family protein [Pararhodospirillum oryzae]GEO80414.1 hypothetical protein ROR02_05450 [Pararhodospirillum oryzae]
MCTVVLDWRPGTVWPLLLAGNRDEMRSRPWEGPARHWPDRPDVLAPIDSLAGGSWIGLNETGVVACVLNRLGTLGPAPGRRSRGELVLDALDHADAVDGAQALAELDGRAYRPFNLIVADNRDAFWIRHADPTGTAPITVHPLPVGLSVLTALDLNDEADPRLAGALPRLRALPRPNPEDEEDGWHAWQAVLADTTPARPDRPTSAVCFMTEQGFGTVCSTLVALPEPGHARGQGRLWFAAGPPDRTPFQRIV